MAEISLATLVQRLRHLAADRREDHTDADLLQRYVESRDALAFEVLVWRHAPVVLGVCRRLLHREQDAEDVFQAAFLALAQQARSIHRQQAVCGWLYAVASRLAQKVRARRVECSLENPAAVRDRTPEAADTRELRQVLDEEVNRLPGNYRQAFILCCLEGLSNTEAARELGCAKGTVDSRLAWARRRLQARLTRRGIGLATVAAAVGATPSLLKAAPPACELVGRTLGLLAQWEQDSVHLGNTTIQALLGETMSMTSRKWLVATILSTILISLGGLGWAMSAGHLPAPFQPEAKPAAVAALPEPVPPVPGKKGPEPKPEVQIRNFSFAGSILAPDGSPVAHARLYFISDGIRKQQDCAEGKFAFKNEPIPVRDDPSQKAPTGWFRLVATSPEHGFIWGPSFQLIARPRQRWEMTLGNEIFEGTDPNRSFSLQFHESAPCAGQVVDEAGKPLANTVIRVQNGEFMDQKANPDIFRVIGDPFLPENLDDASLTARTDAAGRFQLRLPKNSRAALRIEHPDYAPLAGFIDHSPAAKGKDPKAGAGKIESPVWAPPMTVTLIKPRTVHVRVVDEVNQQPLAGIKIMAYLPPLTSSPLSQGITDGNGNLVLRLPPGRFLLWGMAAEESRQFIPTGGDLTVANEPAQKQTFQLKRGRMLRIEVVDADTGIGIPNISFTQTFAKDKINALNLGRSSQAGLLETLATVSRGDFKVEAVAPPGHTVIEAPADWIRGELGEPLALRFRMRAISTRSPQVEPRRENGQAGDP